MFLSFLLHKTNMKLFNFAHLLQLSIVSATLSAFGRLYECKATWLDLTIFTDRSRVRSTASHWGKLYSVSMDTSYIGQCMHQEWSCMWHRTKYSHWPVKNDSKVTGIENSNQLLIACLTRCAKVSINYGLWKYSHWQTWLPWICPQIHSRPHYLHRSSIWSICSLCKYNHDMTPSRSSFYCSRLRVFPVSAPLPPVPPTLTYLDLTYNVLTNLVELLIAPNMLDWIWL